MKYGEAYAAGGMLLCYGAGPLQDIPRRDAWAFTIVGTAVAVIALAASVLSVVREHRRQQKAADHPIIALLFAGLAFSLPVTLAALFASWRVSRPVKYTAEDRKALTSAAARLRHAARLFNDKRWPDDEHGCDDMARALERMAGR